MTPEERFIQWTKIVFAILGGGYVIHLLRVIAYGQ